jgi:hypothetical protein
MANIRVFVEGNYFFVNDGVNIDVQDYKSNVFVDPLGSGQFKVFSDKFGSFIVDVDATNPNAYPTNGIAVNATDVAYTTATWKTFYTENIGTQPTSSIQLDSILSLDYLQIAKGLVPGVSVIQKSGRNPNVTSGSVPEDVWNGSAVYGGFPLGSPEILRFSSSNAGDTGTLTYNYLATNTSTAWQTATVVLNGTTPVLGVSAWRVHSASYSNVALTFNVGTITCQHNVTTANIFFQMPAGVGQTYVSVYTIPFGSTGFVKTIFAGVNTTTSMAVQHAIWIRETGKSPRLRRNGSFSNALNFTDNEVMLKLPALTDITLRIISTTSNTAQIIVGGFDIIQFNTVL